MSRSRKPDNVGTRCRPRKATMPMMSSVMDLLGYS
jgi:hypothetical protein